MDINELKQLLKDGAVKVIFTKKDGSLREMLCTTSDKYLSFESESTSKPSDTIITVWDMEKEAWRAFRVDSIKSFELKFNF